MAVDGGAVSAAGKGSFRMKSMFAPRTTSYLRVLYNDERVRILSTSTQGSPDQREEGGLIQVQVDATLVLGEAWRPAYEQE